LHLAKRPGIRRAIELVERREADVVIVLWWSRLSREGRQQAAVLDRIEQVGGRVKSATEPVDASTAGGRFSREALLAVARPPGVAAAPPGRAAGLRRQPAPAPVPAGRTGRRPYPRPGRDLDRPVVALSVVVAYDISETTAAPGSRPPSNSGATGSSEACSSARSTTPSSPS